MTDGPAFIERIQPYLGWAQHAGAKAELLKAILDSALEPNIPGAIIPVVEGQELRFLACAKSAAEWERLRPLLLAHVGVTLSDFDGSLRPPASDEELYEQAKASGIDVITELRPRKGVARECVDALVALTATLAAAPPEAEFAPRSTAQLLAAFRFATAAGDRPGAEAAVSVLRAEMRLDALNIAFLEVQLDAALGDWHRLRERWFFDQLCASRRPPRVTAALAESLYWSEIAPVEEEAGAPDLVEVFRERCLERFGRLFTVPPPRPSTAVAVAFLLAAAAGSTPDRDRAVLLLRAAPGPNLDTTALRSMASRLFGEEILEVVDHGATAGAESVLERAVRAFQAGAPSTLDEVRAALRAAYALQTLDSATRVVAAVLALPEAERRTLLADRATAAIWEDLVAASGGEAAPTDWVAFLSAAPDMAYEEARQWAEAAAVELPITNQLAGKGETIAFIAALQRWFSDSEATFYAVLPSLLEWAKADESWPNVAYRDLYVELLELLVIGTGRSSEAVAAAGLLLGAVLQLGIGVPQYGQIADELGGWVTTAVAPRDMDPVLDLADVIANSPCPDPDARTRFWSSFLAAIDPHAGRLTAVQIAALQDMAVSLGAAEWITRMTPAAVEGTAAAARVPRGFHIAIYTLLESAGQRVQRALQVIHPQANVDLFTEHASTPRLVQAAARADIFVVCWAAAKHAATQAVSDHRPSDRPTLYPRGVGSASVLREIEDQIAAHDFGPAPGRA